MLGFALGTLAVAVAAGYNTMAPRSQLYGRTVTGSRNRRLLALTYDDGPTDDTRHLLEVLAKHDVRATFFMLGTHVAQAPKVAAEVAGAGHEIGNHSYTHLNLIFATPAQIELQIESCTRALTDAVGLHSNLFRPPFGGRRPAVLRITRKLGLVPVMWSVSAYDWKPYSPENIEYKVARQVRGGDIILMHDGDHLAQAGRSATVEATDRLIRRFKGQGYEFVTVPEMLRAAHTP